MKIVIDVRMIGEFSHGIARYAYNLIKGITSIGRYVKKREKVFDDFCGVLSLYLSV